MTSLDLLNSRRSVPALQLGEPGPDAEQMEQLLTAAMRVPDHGKLTPWRFVLLEGEARRELGRRLADLHLRKDPELPEAKQIKDRERYQHAPLIVAVIAQLQGDHPKIPEQEQLLSAGCVAYSLLLGAHAMGFAAQWLTGWAAYDRDAAQLLGLESNECVVGFVHIGTPSREMPERDRPELSEKLSRWQP